MSYSTDDCKQFLITKYPSTTDNSWKRISKKKVNDIVQRVFYNEDIGNVVLNDVNNKLVMNYNINQELNKSIITIKKKVFNKELEEIAEKLMFNYDGKYAYDEMGKSSKIPENEKYEQDAEDLLENKYLARGYEALPSCFTFNFPNELYENLEENVTNGINTLMKIGSQESFAVVFDNKNTHGQETGHGDILILGPRILPDWLEFADETSVKLLNNAPDITVFELFKLLVEMGFTYDRKNCLFAKELKKIKIVS